MTKFKSHFQFNKQERSGIFFLLLLIFCLQLLYFIISSNTFLHDSTGLTLNEDIQAAVDGLMAEMNSKKKDTLYPFNPNYMDDHKGYTLGMSPQEIDRFLQFRSQGRYINSAAEFQKISGISDARLKEIAPYFKFPDWQTSKNRKAPLKKSALPATKNAAKIQDLNRVTAAQLMRVSGIGEVLSRRIIKFRKALGGFVVDEQLLDVYGIEPAVGQRVLERYRVLGKPEVNKISLNNATHKELTALVYINYDLAKKIITYRTDVGGFGSLDELSEIPDFPSDKIERIKLYLSL